MASFQWYLTKRREALLEEVHRSPDSAHRDLSELLEEALVEWLKAHGKGNPDYSLDHFADPEAKAFPSPWRTWMMEDLQPYTAEEMEEMQLIMVKRVQQLEVLKEKRRMTRAG